MKLPLLFTPLFFFFFFFFLFLTCHLFVKILAIKRMNT
jgi:hypothetical protein